MITPHRTETVTLDVHIPYDKNKGSIRLFKQLQDQFPFESDQQIAARRKAIQDKCSELMYELNPDEQDWDYFKSGSKTRRKKPKLTYKYYNHVTVISSNVAKELLPSRLTQHERFMIELKKWARNRPEDTDEVLANALEKYSQLLITHPNKLNSYYMQAIKNNHIKLWEASQAQKRKHETDAVYLEDTENESEFGVEDYYPSDTESWWSDLSNNEREGIMQAVEWIAANEDAAVPESIKRKVRHLRSARKFKVSGSTGKTNDSNITVSQQAGVETRQLSPFEKLQRANK